MKIDFLKKITNSSQIKNLRNKYSKLSQKEKIIGALGIVLIVIIGNSFIGGKKQLAITLSNCNRNENIQSYLNKGWKIVSSNSRRVTCSKTYNHSKSTRLGGIQYDYVRGTEVEYILSK